MMESHLLEKRPAYINYQKIVSRFLLWPRKNTGQLIDIGGK